MLRSITLTLTLGLATLTGCNAPDPIREIDQSVDCADVCNRYRDCYDSSYDVDSCRDRCEGYVDSDGGMPFAANECDTCLDARSCAGSAFSCADECSPLLP